MKFQNLSFKFFLNRQTNKRTNGRTDGRTNRRTSRKQYAPHFFKVGGIMNKMVVKIISVGAFQSVTRIFSLRFAYMIVTF